MRVSSVHYITPPPASCQGAKSLRRVGQCTQRPGQCTRRPDLIVRVAVGTSAMSGQTSGMRWEGWEDVVAGNAEGAAEHRVGVGKLFVGKSTYAGVVGFGDPTFR